MRKKKMEKTLSLVMVSLIILSMLSPISPRAKAEEIVWNTNPTPLPTPAFSHMSIAKNGKIYVISGYVAHGGVVSTSVYFADVNVDGTIGSWQETTPLPEWRTATVTVVWNDYIYVIGGGGPVWDGRSEQNTVYYASINPDGTIGNWGSTTLLPERIVGAEGVVWDGRIYVAGGWNGFSRQDKVYFADINEVDGTLGNWQTTTALPLTLNLMCALAHDGAIYIIGGIHSHIPQSSAHYALIDETDGTLGAWTATSSLPEGRARADCTLIGDSLYVIGGQEGHESALPEKTVYKTTMETPGLGSWEELESLPEERREHSVVTLNGRIYVMGGLNFEMNLRDTIYYSSTLETITPPFWTQWWFWTIVALGITTSVLTFTTVRYRKKTRTLKEPEVIPAKPVSKKECKVCPNCGAKLPVDSAFCGKCGNTLK